MQAAKSTDVTGIVFDIQRFSIHDGPGIRTTVFFKGCPLRCAWCHNPEGISPQPRLSFVETLCIGCRACVEACQHGVHRFEGGRHLLDRDACRACGACVEACPPRALELAGREVSASDVLSVVVRDRPFCEESGGGMTLSGGEPAMQPDFAVALLRAAKEEALHCCVETCGHCRWEHLERMAPHVDVFLYDYKETDPERHRRSTGVDNALILENLRQLDRAGARIVLRCPIVPGLNDRDDHFAGIARVAGGLENLLWVDLLPYHRLGLGKRERFGLDGLAIIDAETPSAEAVEEWRRKIGGDVRTP